MAPPLNRVNTLLLVTVVALALLLGWQPLPSPLPENQPLSELSADQVTTITLRGRATEPLRITRRDQQWWLSAPRPLRADAEKVDAILAILSTGTYDRFPTPSPPATEQFITADHHHWIRFNQFQINFGQAHPLGQRRYLQLSDSPGDQQAPITRNPGSQIALIDDLFYHHLRSNWFDWVSRQPLPPAITLTRLNLPGLDLQYETGNPVTGQAGRWQSTPPEASADQINALIPRWQHLRANRVTPLPPGLNTEALPTVVVEGLTAEGTTTTLTLSVQNDSRELRLHSAERGVTYHLDPATAELLLLINPTRN